MEGEEITLAPEEVDVWTRPKEGYAVAEEIGYIVAISTELTDDLVEEGMARELVRRIQTMRKDAGFRIEDTIKVWYQTDDKLSRVFARWSDYIQGETLATSLASGEAPEGAYTESQTVDGEVLTLGLVRNE